MIQFDNQVVRAATTGSTRMGNFSPTSLVFGPNEPDCFFESDPMGLLPYRGQDSAKERLTRYIGGLGLEHVRMKALLTGQAGTGKTTLARIIAHQLIDRQIDLGWDIGGSYWELLPSQVAAKQKLDEFMLAVTQDPYAVVFIDEVHELANREALFHVLHDTGALKYPLESGRWIDVPPTISWLAATTDPGALDDTNGGALRRRLEPEIQLEAPSKDDLAAIIQDQGVVDSLPVDDEAAVNIAERALFPWQARFIYKEAKLSARLAGATELTPTHAADAFRIMRIDRMGLLPEDRAVLAALLKLNGGKGIPVVSQPGVNLYKMGEESLCAIAGVDRITYKKRVQPKLFRLGLMVVRSGQCLTDRAVDEYGWLRYE